MEDMISHPPHYNKGAVECIDAIESAVSDLSGFEGVCTGAAIKYLWRWKQKGGIESLRKAQWYIDRLIKQLEQQPDQRRQHEDRRNDEKAGVITTVSGV